MASAACLFCLTIVRTVSHLFPAQHSVNHVQDVRVPRIDELAAGDERAALHSLREVRRGRHGAPDAAVEDDLGIFAVER